MPWAPNLKIGLADAGISGSGNMKESKSGNKKESINNRIKEVNHNFCLMITET